VVAWSWGHNHTHGDQVTAFWSWVTDFNRRQAQNHRYEVLDGPGTIATTTSSFKERGSTLESHDSVSQFTEGTDVLGSQDRLVQGPPTGGRSLHPDETRQIVDTILFGEVRYHFSVLCFWVT
jgi:hypothetical protein